MSLSVDTKSLVEDHYPHLLDYVETEGSSWGELVEIYQDLCEDFNLAESVVAEDFLSTCIDLFTKLVMSHSIYGSQVSETRK